MFTPKKPTQPKGESTQIAFRVPKDLERYIKDAEALGYSKTEVVLRMLGVARDASDELGGLWTEVEKRATDGETRPGVVLGRLAKAALKK